MLALLDGIKWIVVVVGTIVILSKVFPMIADLSRSIKENKKEKEHLANQEKRRIEEIGKLGNDLSDVMDQLVNVKCPDCGEMIPPEDLRPVCYCSFCGRRVEIKESLLQDAMKYSNDEKNRRIELQQIQQAKRENDRRTVIVIALLILLLVGLCIGLYHLWK